MQSRMLAPAVAVALAGLAAPASDAAASGLTITNGTCFAAGQPVALSGTGFTAGRARHARAARRRRRSTADVARRLQRDAPRAAGVRGPRAPHGDGSRPPTARTRATRAAGVVPRRARRPATANYAQALNGPPAQRTTWRFAGLHARPGDLRAPALGRPGAGHAPLRRRAGSVRHAHRAGARVPFGCVDARPLAAAGRPAPALVSPHGAAARHHRGGTAALAPRAEAGPLEHRQVAVELPGRDLHAGSPPTPGA